MEQRKSTDATEKSDYFEDSNRKSPDQNTHRKPNPDLACSFLKVQAQSLKVILAQLKALVAIF